MLVNSMFNRIKHWKKIIIPLMVAIITLPTLMAGSVGVVSTHIAPTPIVRAAKKSSGKKSSGKSKSSSSSSSDKGDGSDSNSDSNSSGTTTDSMTGIVQSAAKGEQDFYTQSPTKNKSLWDKAKTVVTSPIKTAEQEYGRTKDRVEDMLHGESGSKVQAILGVTPSSKPGNQWTVMAAGNGLLHMLTKNSYSTGYGTLSARTETRNQGRAAEYGLDLYDMGLDHSSESSIALDMFDRIGRLFGGLLLYVGIFVDVLDYSLFHIVMKLFNFINPARLIAHPNALYARHSALAPLSSMLSSLIKDCKVLGIIGAFFSLIITFTMDFISRKRPSAWTHPVLKWAKKIFFITAVPLIVVGCFQFAEHSMGTMFAQDQDSASAYAIDSGMVNFKDWVNHSRLALPHRYNNVLPYGENANMPPTTHQMTLAINDQGAGLKTAHLVNTSATSSSSDTLNKNGFLQSEQNPKNQGGKTVVSQKYGVNSELIDMINAWMHDSPYTSADWESYVGAHLPDKFYQDNNFRKLLESPEEEGYSDQGSAKVAFPFARNGTLDVKGTGKNATYETMAPSSEFGPMPADNYGGISTIGMFNYLRSIFKDHGFEWVSATDLTNTISSPTHKDVGMTGTGGGFVCNFLMILTLMYVVGFFGLGIIWLDGKMMFKSLPNLTFKGMATEVGFVGSFKSMKTWGPGIRFLVTALQLIACLVLTSLLFAIGRSAMIAVSQFPDQWFGPSAFNDNSYGGSGFIMKTLEGLGMSSSEAGAYHASAYYVSLLLMAFLLWLMLVAFLRNFTQIRKGLEQMFANIFQQLFSSGMNKPSMNNHSLFNGGNNYSNNNSQNSMLMNSHSLMHAVSASQSTGGGRPGFGPGGAGVGGAIPAGAGAGGGAPGIPGTGGNPPAGLMPSGDTRGNQIKQDGAQNANRFGGNSSRNNVQNQNGHGGYSNPSGRGIPGAASERGLNGESGNPGQAGHGKDGLAGSSPFGRNGASGRNGLGTASTNPGAAMLNNHPGLGNGSFPGQRHLNTNTAPAAAGVNGQAGQAARHANGVAQNLGAGAGQAQAQAQPVRQAQAQNGLGGFGRNGFGGIGHNGLGRNGLGGIGRNGLGNVGASAPDASPLGGGASTRTPAGMPGMSGAPGVGGNASGQPGANGLGGLFGSPTDRLGDAADNLLGGAAMNGMNMNNPMNSSVSPRSALIQNSRGGNYGRGGNSMKQRLSMARRAAIRNGQISHNTRSLNNSRHAQSRRMGLFGSPNMSNRRRQILRHIHMPKNASQANNMVRSAMGAKHFANQAANGIRNKPSVAPARVQAVAKQSAHASQQLRGAQLGASMLHEAQPLGAHLMNPNFNGQPPTNGQARMALKSVYSAQNHMAHVGSTHQGGTALRQAGSRLTNATSYARHLGINPSAFSNRPRVANTLRGMNSGLTKAISGRANTGGGGHTPHIVNNKIIKNISNNASNRTSSIRNNSVLNSVIQNNNRFHR